MVRRRPADVSPIPKRDPYSPDGPASLASTLDKGFPYDDWKDKDQSYKIYNS